MKQILIIDDNTINQACAQSALGDVYQVIGAITASQGMQYLQHLTPDLLLLDLNMPLMNGYEMMRRVRADARTAGIPIVFLSYEKDAVTEARCLELGAVDFIPKPFVASILKSRIAKIFQNIEAKNQLSSELNAIKDRSQRDPLTGLFNRNYANSAVDEKLRNGSVGALFMIDMDNFKAINDNYGHDAGDRTLQMFADTLRSYAEENDVTCRIGGDEFVMFVDGVTDKMQLADRAASIIADLSQKIEECKFETNSSVSVGIAIVGSDGHTFNDLYNAADKALYYVKMNGKNSFHFFSEESAVEESRKSVMLDLHGFHEAMLRSDHEKSSVYSPGFQGITNVYQFLCRQAEPAGRLILLNLQPEEGAEDGQEKAAEILEAVLKRCLPRTAMQARYSTKQFLIHTQDLGDEEAVALVGQIGAEYGNDAGGNRINLFYETITLSALR
ncbi:MAG: diguanylate cyclase [Lachnospiraceae bacterium]|nr:diguanylate cyclase [Lachnospiraceae bacterium]